MITLNVSLNNDLIKQAREFEQRRTKCKNFLKSVNKDYDKFTLVAHDSFIAYISEYFLKKYFDYRFAELGVTSTSWENDIDITQINRIIETDTRKANDITYIKNYFYDRYDIKLCKGEKTLLIDVKTALTEKEPTLDWNFMYPKVQAHQEGKDVMVLTYYVVADIQNMESLKKIVIVGYTAEETIQQCKLIQKGEKTRFGTTSQLDNYETELAVHYKSVRGLINLL